MRLFKKGLGVFIVFLFTIPLLVSFHSPQKVQANKGKKVKRIIVEYRALANPATFYFQTPGGHWKYTQRGADHDVAPGGTPEDPRPATTQVDDQIDMRNYGNFKTAVFRDPTGKHPGEWPVSQVKEIKLTGAEFNEKAGNGSFKGISREIRGDYTVWLLTETGEAYIPTEVVTNGYGTLNIMYITPMDVIWQGVIEIEEDCEKGDPECTPDEKPDPGGATCNPPEIIGGKLRYDYELDLVMKRVDGETVEKNSTVNTPVTVFRDDFSKNREKVRKEIQKDLDRAKSELSKLESELSQLESQLASLESELSSLESDLAVARRGYEVEVCDGYWDSDDDWVENCWWETRYDYALISSLEGQVSTKKSQIKAKKAEIEKKKCEIQYKKAEIRGFEKELKDLKDLEEKFRIVTPDVTISFGGAEKGRQPVSLKEGETKKLIFPWTLPDNGQISAEINLNPKKYDNELTYDNNKLNTPIYIATHEVGACGPPNQEVKLKAVVMTVTTDTEGTKLYYEHFTAQVQGVSPNKMRAGYGFTYGVNSTYKNEWDNQQSTPEKAVATYSYTTKNVNTNKQNLEMKSDTGYTTTYHPQMYYVEEFSGIVYSSKPTRTSTSDDVILEAGRKWYSEFDQTDGVYPVQIKVGEQGVNGLTLCPTTETEIQGTAMDDFIRRSVLPEDPFPAQSAGWNWKGKESILSNLKEWILEK